MPLATRARSPIAKRWGGSAVQAIAAATSVDTLVLPGRLLVALLGERGERQIERVVDLEERVQVRDAQARQDPARRRREQDRALLDP